jgi:hypothetical protein
MPIICARWVGESWLSISAYCPFGVCSIKRKAVLYAVPGLGGVGKSALAAQWADLHARPHHLARLIKRPGRPGPIDELTRREREVLALIAEDRSNQGISQILVLSL